MGREGDGDRDVRKVVFCEDGLKADEPFAEEEPEEFGRIVCPASLLGGVCGGVPLFLSPSYFFLRFAKTDIGTVATDPLGSAAFEPIIKAKMIG